MANDLLLEIGSDEIPARYLPLAIRDLRVKAESALRAARLEFSDVKTYGTPRRLVLLVSDLSEMSREAVFKVRGPSKKVAYDEAGNPTRALTGFAKSLGVDPSQVWVEGDGGGEYVYGERREPGRPVGQVLPEVLPPVIMGLECPYPLRWGDQGWRWYRPIRWVVCLYGKDVIPLSIAGIASGRTSLGHRTLHPGPVEIEAAGSYFRAMDECGVMVDPSARKERIVDGARRAAAELGGLPVIDEDLLSEVSSLCEHPSPFLGRFEERYSKLPREVLITAMQHHQRYFPIESSDGAVLPGFVGVRDGDETAGMDTVRAGNEWVLRARLEDAEFFFHQDRKVRLEDRLPELAGVRFLRNSGSMLDKARRIQEMTLFIADLMGMGDDEKDLARRAAELAKADLVTSMVREFPELEGIMGGRYAELEGLPALVAQAIREQYLPRGARDQLPGQGVPSAVALADKLDTLAVSFCLGTEVSGSADPFGLRRHAMGVAAIIIGRSYDVDLGVLLGKSIDLASQVVPRPVTDAKAKLLQFLMARVEGMLLERGLVVEVVRAVLGGAEKRIARLPVMASALAGISGTERLVDVVTGWRRTSVLAKGTDSREVSRNLLKEEPEAALYEAVAKVRPELDRDFEHGDYAGYLDLLASLRGPIDKCLDGVLIMAQDPDIRANRLALLKTVSELFTRYADFAHLLPLIGREST